MQTQEPTPNHEFPTPDPLMQWSMIFVFLMGLGKRFWERWIQKDEKEDEVAKLKDQHIMDMNTKLLDAVLKSRNA